ncbi:MAG: PAS domain S-box protein [Polyangiaceae bacterium]|nr:PAS domain S-box protein [Polyangiaceae bacterium]
MSSSGGMVLPEEACRSLLDHWADGTFLLDRSLTIRRACDKAARLLGISTDRLAGTSLVDLAWDPGTFDDMRTDLPGSASIRRAWGIRSLRASDGRRLFVEMVAHGRDDEIVCIAHDVTARASVEERLARSEASFRALIERSCDMIAVHREGRIVYANSALATLLAWTTADELVGSPLIELVHPEDRPQTAERIRSLRDDSSTVPFVEVRLLRKDGGHLPAWVGAVNVVFDGLPCILAIGRDMTEQRRLQAQLALADRMASLGTLAAGVAHEINNPLTYVLLGLDAVSGRLRRARKHIERGAPPAELSATLDDVDALLETTTEGAQRVRKIVWDLRRFGRAEEDTRALVSVESAIDLAVGMATHELRHRARVERHDQGEMPPVSANEGRLAQVFLNLLINAAHSFPQQVDRNRIDIRTQSNETSVVVHISDNGSGIATEHLPRLFDPFFTTKPVGMGTGLGLSVCHGIISSFGGTITVESTLGEGSTFTVTLPTQLGPPSQRPSQSRPDMSGRPRRLRVLVVDDEEAIGRSLGAALASLGEIVTASTVARAKEMILVDPTFDIVLTDVRMPDEGGLGLRRWLKDHHPGLSGRVLFMTGGRLEDHERAELDDQPELLLVKPFDCSDLVTRIEALVSPGKPRLGR